MLDFTNWSEVHANKANRKTGYTSKRKAPNEKNRLKKIQQKSNNKKLCNLVLHKILNNDDLNCEACFTLKKC